MDCPICMEVINFNKNCVITECGHSFHTSCLMKNIAHNGFDCPYCRSVMAETPEDEETDYIDYGSDEDDSDEDEDEDAEDELYDDYTLRGFRFFMNNIQNITHDEDDINEEQEYQDSIGEQDAIPSPEFVSNELMELGVTYEQLVKSILTRDHDEYENYRELSRIGGYVFGKIRVIISDYEHETEIPLPVIETPVIPLETESRPLPIDFEAQPKNRIRI